jgi:DNA-binding transcriptional ArsR family regulator
VNPGMVVVIDGGGRVELRVDAETAEMRREVGVAAWSVLEVLALGGAVDDSGRWMTYSNARHLAASLGIGKDRAAAALSKLRRAGLIAAHVERDQRSARFARSRYEVRIPVSRDPDTALPASIAGPVHPSPATTRSRRAHATDDTPNLFDQHA